MNIHQFHYSPQQAAITGIKPFLYHILWWGKGKCQQDYSKGKKAEIPEQSDDHIFQRKTTWPGVMVQQFFLHGGRQARSLDSERVSLPKQVRCEWRVFVILSLLLFFQILSNALLLLLLKEPDMEMKLCYGPNLSKIHHPIQILILAFYQEQNKSKEFFLSA